MDKDTASAPLKDSNMRKIQETALRHGISGPIARTVAMNELYNWSSEEFSSVLHKVKGWRSTDPSIQTNPADVRSSSMAMITTGTTLDYVKAPLEMIKRSAEERLALCVNAAGEWSLRKDGYMAISHVWEEGIRADEQNRGIAYDIVQGIFEKIGKVGVQWIWLDGLAIPSGNMALSFSEEILKTDIINSLAAIYDRAEGVIIFDALVMKLQSNDPADVAVCLACGRWMQRVWTYQEVKLAKQAIILTGTGVLSFKDMVESLRISCNIKPGGGFGKEADSDMDPSHRKYHKLFKTFRLLEHDELIGISLCDVAMSCQSRKTGNDIDYARAFFPILGLTWKTGMTKEEGMRDIYDCQRRHAKRLVLMHGSPRTTYWPAWAPAHLVGLEGEIVDGGEWKHRGLKGSWYTCRIKNRRDISKPSAFLFELETYDEQGEFLCGCLLNPAEGDKTLKGFGEAITQGRAFLLSKSPLSPGSVFATNCLLVERVDLPDFDEAYVYLTAAMTAFSREYLPQQVTWLLRHESPISTHDLSGKGISELFHLMSDQDRNENETELHVAAREAKMTALHLLLGQGAELEAQNKRGWTPLHSAAFAGHPEVVKILVQANANVHAQDNLCRTPLALAAHQGHNAAIEQLLDAGSDINFSNNNNSPLNKAILNNRIETIRLLLSRGADSNKPDGLSFSPLLLGVKDPQIVDVLLTAGAYPQWRHSSGATAIHFAARGGYADSIRSLIRAGVDVDIAENTTETRARNPLYHAVRGQHEDAVRTLLYYGADPNTTFENDWTPIMLAAETGHTGIASALLDAGADPRRACQPEGWSPLHIAARNGRRVLVKLFVGNGAEVGLRDNQKQTALDLATEAGHGVICEILRAS